MKATAVLEAEIEGVLTKINGMPQTQEGVTEHEIKRCRLAKKTAPITAMRNFMDHKLTTLWHSPQGGGVHTSCRPRMRCTPPRECENEQCNEIK